MFSAIVFTEEMYTDGTVYVAKTGSNTGCPPALPEDMSVCTDVQPGYKELSTETIELIVEAMGPNRPVVDILFRSTSSEYPMYDTLCLEAFLLQMFMTDGKNHPLYKAVTQRHFADFKAGIEAYKNSIGNIY